MLKLSWQGLRRANHGPSQSEILQGRITEVFLWLNQAASNIFSEKYSDQNYSLFCCMEMNVVFQSGCCLNAGMDPNLLSWVKVCLCLQDARPRRVGLWLLARDARLAAHVYSVCGRGLAPASDLPWPTPRKGGAHCPGSALHSYLAPLLTTFTLFTASPALPYFSHSLKAVPGTAILSRLPGLKSSFSLAP